MASWLRRGALSGAVSLSLGPLLLVGAAGSAHAFDGTNLNPPKVARLANGIPAPVAVPSSVIGSLDNATALERARMVGNTVPAGVVAGKIPGSALGGVISKVGTPVFVGYTGFQLGWSFGSGVASLMGMDSDAAMSELLGDTPLQPAPGYVVNGDVGVVPPPGWVNGVNYFDSAIYTNNWQAIKVYAVVDEAASADAFQPGGHAVLNWSYTVGGTMPQYVTDGTTVSAYCTSGGIGSTSAPFYASEWPPPPKTFTCPAGYGLQRLEMTRSGVKNTWYPKGSPQRPAEKSTDPVRQWETRWTCSNASTGLAQSVAFQESDAKWPAMPKAQCASGLQVDSVEVWEVVPTDHNMDTRISSWTRSAAVKDWQAAYPECGDGSCLLVLQRVDATTGTWTSCFSVPGPCAQWSTDPNKTSTYRCMYGTHLVALDQCNAYTPTFDPAVNVDTPFADPKTGETPDPGPTPAPPENAKCWPNGWGVFRPDLWVLTPIKCAFIPPAGTFEAGWSKVDIDWCSTAPGALSCAVGDVFGPFTHLGEGVDPEDCLGVGITVPNLLDRGKDGRMYPLSACSDAAKAVQAFWIPFATGAVYLGAIMLGARMVSKTIGADDAVPS